MGTHFFTGFPGFIASQLIKGLIKNKKMNKLYVLVQESQLAHAKESIQVIFDELGATLPFEIIPGDITLNNFGMTEQELEKIQTETIKMWHLAAIDEIDGKKERAWKVNEEGTQRV